MNLPVYIFIAIYFICSNAFAYIGPGMGLGAIGVLLGIIFSIFLFVISIFWYPIKKLIKSKKNRAKTDKDNKNISASGILYKNFVFFFFGAFIVIFGNIFIAILPIFSSEAFHITFSDPPTIEEVNVWVDQPDKIHDELITICPSVKKSKKITAHLLNNKGKKLHTWKHDLTKLRSHDVYSSAYKFDFNKSIIDCSNVHPLPDGGLIILAKDTAQHVSPPGYSTQHLASLVKLDKESNVIWERFDEYHHDLDINESGKIIIPSSVTNTFNNHLEIHGNGGTVYSEHMIINILDLHTGETISRTDLTEAFLNGSFKHYVPTSYKTEYFSGKNHIDQYHANSVDYIEKSHAAKWDIAKEGDILISLRQMSLVVLLRPSEKKIIWARRGPWRAQHFARITNEGTITVFDNEGEYMLIANDDGNGYKPVASSRAIEYNPSNESIRLWYKNDPERTINSVNRSHFYLRNNYAMIAPHQQGRLIQVDDEQNVVWELRMGPNRSENYQNNPMKWVKIQSFEKDYFSDVFLKFLRH